MEANAWSDKATEVADTPPHNIQVAERSVADIIKNRDLDRQIAPYSLQETDPFLLYVGLRVTALGKTPGHPQGPDKYRWEPLHLPDYPHLAASSSVCSPPCALQQVVS